MGAMVIDGKGIAKQIRNEVGEEVQKLGERGLVPGLAAIIVGNDPASEVYINMKMKACDKAGIYHETIEKPDETTQEELLRTIEKLNGDMNIHGILVQLPLPRHIDESVVLESIDPLKDVDGFHPLNLGNLFLGTPSFVPCTPLGVQELLVRSGHHPDGKRVVIVGRSNIVGKPLMAMLVQKEKGANATVTMCHTGTTDLGAITREADILIVAMGRPKAITADMVKEGAVVIDVGIHRLDDPSAKRGYSIVGDVDFENVAPKCLAISPVPGGVGPMTIAMLLNNTVLAAKYQAELEGDI